jgi:hypothetical protein
MRHVEPTWLGSDLGGVYGIEQLGFGSNAYVKQGGLGLRYRISLYAARRIG